MHFINTLFALCHIFHMHIQSIWTRVIYFIDNNIIDIIKIYNHKYTNHTHNQYHYDVSKKIKIAENEKQGSMHCFLQCKRPRVISAELSLSGYAARWAATRHLTEQYFASDLAGVKSSPHFWQSIFSRTLPKLCRLPFLRDRLYSVLQRLEQKCINLYFRTMCSPQKPHHSPVSGE